MKRLFLITILIFLIMNIGYPKTKAKIKKKVTKIQTEIIEFKTERSKLVAALKDYEEYIQNLKYRISQLSFIIEYLEKKETKK